MSQPTYNELRLDLARALSAYDSECTERRSEVARCHRELSQLRQQLATVTAERDSPRTTGRKLHDALTLAHEQHSELCREFHAERADHAETRKALEEAEAGWHEQRERAQDWRCSVADPKAPEMVAFPESLYSALGGGAVGSPCMVSLEMVRSALSAHGLHICSEADKRVLEAMADVDEETLTNTLESRHTTLENKALAKAELARRSGT